MKFCLIWYTFYAGVGIELESLRATNAEPSPSKYFLDWSIPKHVEKNKVRTLGPASYPRGRWM